MNGRNMSQTNNQNNNPNNSPEKSNDSPQNSKGAPTLEVEERRGKVWDLHIRGASKSAIAKAMNVSIGTVYADLEAIGKNYKDQILKTDPIRLVSDSIHWLDEMERVALHEISTASRKVQKVRDPNTGEMVEVEVADPNKSKFYSAALQARKLKLNLFLDTGIIPKDSPEKLFQGLENYQKHEEDLEQRERSPEEIQQSIYQLLKSGNSVQQAFREQEEDKKQHSDSQENTEEEQENEEEKSENQESELDKENW